jgi:hypothetical protein
MPQNSSNGKKKNSGDKNITIGGNVTNSTIIIGDSNSVNSTAPKANPKVAASKKMNSSPIVSEGEKLIPFLCYAKENQDIVREFSRRLKSEGWIDPWFDEEDILPGQIWQDSVVNAVRQSHAVIVFLSQVAIASEGFFHKELKLALDTAAEKPEGTIFIIPIRIDDCDVPLMLMKYQYVDYFGDKLHKDQVYSSLIASLRNRAASVGIKL